MIDKAGALIVICLLSIGAPSRTYILATSCKKNKCIQYKSRNAKKTSRGRYWPASSIKLWAAIGALQTLYKHNLDGESFVWWQHPKSYLSYAGKVNRLIYRSIRFSGNRSYDKLLIVARLDSLNSLSKKWNLKSTYLSVAYSTNSKHVKYSPKLQGYKSTIPEHFSKLKSKRCRRNCTSLQDLQTVLLYTILNKFQLKQKDYSNLIKALSLTKPIGYQCVKYYCGKNTKVYAKNGSVPFYHHITNLYARCRNRHIIISIASPMKTRHAKSAYRKRVYKIVCQSIYRLTRQVKRCGRNYNSFN